MDRKGKWIVSRVGLALQIDRHFAAEVIRYS